MDKQPLRFMCGETSVPTDSNGNVFITLPDTFLNRVVYAEAHQSKGSYTVCGAFIFSHTPLRMAQLRRISFAVPILKQGFRQKTQQLKSPIFC
ncbi:hypothetical protein [Escherichia coli]|uniref:hypothetical protein n=1 Tax=Escherichia coli TaxID=562 RepID=UPI0037DCECFC